jgi:hypothetical protein
MALRKPLTVDGPQITRLQIGDILRVERLNLGVIGDAVPVLLNTITMTQSRHQLFATGTAAQRTLRTIFGGVEGDILILQISPLSSACILDDNTGNLRLAGDFTLTNPRDKIVLLFDDPDWHELVRSNND